METCVKQNCPFIPYCKDYQLGKDRRNCVTQARILRAARELDKQRSKKGAV